MFKTFFLEGLAAYYVGIFYGHSVYFMAIWYIFPHFGMLYLEKSCNPAFKVQNCKCITYLDGTF
jgi:hypothetical protein